MNRLPLCIAMAAAGFFMLVSPLHAQMAARGPKQGPERVVSINLCSDILAAELAAPDTLKSVYRLGPDPHDSPVAEMLQDVPVNDGRIEDVLPFAPDLVLAHEFSSPFTLDLLRRLDIPVVVVRHVRQFEDIAGNIRLVAKALHREVEGEMLVQRFESEMTAAKRPNEDGPSVILYQDLGSTAAPGSILDHVLSHAGFRNVVTETNALGLVYPGIEGVIAMRPDLMVIGAYRPGQPSQASALLEHPALRLYHTRYASELYLPGREWSCSTRFLASTAARLAAMRDDMQQSANKDDAE